MLRKFKGDAIRDTNEGKISYFGFRHPLVEHSFGKYMLKHQICSDGSKREANNWWDGWSEDISIDSLVRHVEDLQAIQAGYTVVKIRHDGKETTELIKPVVKGDLTFSHISTPKGAIVTEVTKEDCYNAARFNCGAGLLEHLKNK